MPDQWGRPTLQDWAGVTQIFNNVTGQIKENQAEQRDVQEAQLTQLYQDDPTAMTAKTSGMDPRVVVGARKKAIDSNTQKLAAEQQFIQTHMMEYDQALAEGALWFNKAQGYKAIGNVAAYNAALDNTFNALPTGGNITKRDGDKVTVVSMLGKEITAIDDLTPEQKEQMIIPMLRTPEKTLEHLYAEDKLRVEENFKAFNNPEPVIDEATGQVLYKSKVIDTLDKLPAVVYRDEAGNIVKVEGAGAQRFLNKQALELKKDLKDLNDPDGGGDGDGEFGKVKAFPNSQYIQVNGKVMANPYFDPEGGKAPVRAPDALNSIVSIRQARLKLEKGEPMDNLAESLRSLNPKAADSILSMVGGGKKEIPPELKKEIQMALDIQEAYLRQFVPNMERFEEAWEKVNKAAGGGEGTAKAPDVKAAKDPAAKGKPANNQTAGAGPVGEGMAELPPPAENKGERILDTETGVIYVSDGKKWDAKKQGN